MNKISKGQFGNTLVVSRGEGITINNRCDQYIYFTTFVK